MRNNKNMEKDPFEDAEYAGEHYADIDDDEDSPLGAAIFFDKFGFTVDELFDEDDEE